MESLAKVLEVSPEDLGNPIDEDTDADWKKAGYTPFKAVIKNDVRLQYALVKRHYGVGLNALIDAAPWMFTLLAELSLADLPRRTVQRSMEDMRSS